MIFLRGSYASGLLNERWNGSERMWPVCDLRDSMLQKISSSILKLIFYCNPILIECNANYSKCSHPWLQRKFVWAMEIDNYLKYYIHLYVLTSWLNTNLAVKGPDIYVLIVTWRQTSCYPRSNSKKKDCIAFRLLIHFDRLACIDKILWSGDIFQGPLKPSTQSLCKNWAAFLVKGEAENLSDFF